MLSDRAMLRLRRASVAARRLPGAVLLLDRVRRAFGRRNRTVTVGDFDGVLRMRLCLHEHMQSQTFWFGYYSRDIILLFDRLLRPGMVVFDIGANVGEIALAAARRVGSHGRVYAFEPVPHLYRSLEEHVAINRLRQVVPVAQGLLDEETECTIFEAPERFGDGMVNTGLATIYGDEIRSRALGCVPMSTLDSYCRRMRIARVDVVKIDVEGAELAVLKGGIETIGRSRPYIVVEVQAETARRAGYAPAELMSFVKSLDYELLGIGRKAKLVPLTDAAKGGFSNVLCAPREAAVP